MLVASVAFQQAPLGNDHPVSYDRTGINWQIPFEAARELAREQGRLLAIKPVAFGTSPKRGVQSVLWSCMSFFQSVIVLIWSCGHGGRIGIALHCRNHCKLATTKDASFVCQRNARFGLK